MKFSRRGGRPEVNISEEEKPKAGRWKVTRSWENMDELERGRAIRISHRTMKRETDFYWRFHGLSVAAIRGSKRCSSACCAFDRYRLDRLNVPNWLKTVPAMCRRWGQATPLELGKVFQKVFSTFACIDKKRSSMNDEEERRRKFDNEGDDSSWEELSINDPLP